MCGPVAHVEILRRGAVDEHGHPVAVAVDDLRAGPHQWAAALRTAGHSRTMASQSCGVRVMTLPAPKLTPPLAAVPGMISRLLAPMLAMVR